MNNFENDLKNQIKSKIDNKTKPIGSLGLLEDIAEKVALIQHSASPELINPHILVFTGDHGIAKSGVSKYPQEVTYQMLLNFLNKGTAINVFSKQHKIKLKIVDAGVIGNFEDNSMLIKAKIAESTKNFLYESAMTYEQFQEAFQAGKSIVKKIAENNCNIIGFGEMGIANTSSASLIMHKFTNIPIEKCIGRGTGLNNLEYQKKIQILTKASKMHNINNNIDILRNYGGFEIVEMVGAYLQAFSENMIIIVDGFISTAALLAVSSIDKNILKNCIFSHQSDESGHKRMLQYLGVTPLLKLNLRLGEGTGAALAYPLIQSTVNFLNEMASFENAGISKS